MPKAWKQLSPPEWQAIRLAYETDPKHPNFTTLSKPHNISHSTVAKRAKAEQWCRQDALALATIQRVQNANSAIVEQTAAKVSAQLAQQLSDSLQPWLEREKTKHVRSQIKRAKIALKQLDAHISPDIALAPKDSSFIAKSAETWDTIARRNLGLNDNTLPAGGLSLSILTNHAAVQVKPA